MTPEGCGIGRAPDGSFRVTGSHADLALWWFREMQGREVGAGYVVGGLPEQSTFSEGISFSDLATGRIVVRTWAQVHRDLGDSFLRASRR